MTWVVDYSDEAMLDINGIFSPSRLEGLFWHA